MKSYKLLFSFLLLSILSINFSFANICPGDTTTLNYSVSGVQPGQSCSAIAAPINFFSPGTPAVSGGSANGSYSVKVPNSGVVGNQGFSLTCGTGYTASTDTDALNVLPLNTSTCCGVGTQVNRSVWYTETSGHCGCPAGRYFDGDIGTTGSCPVLGATSITAVWSGLNNPRVTPSCPTPLTAVSVVRNTGNNTNLTVNGNNAIDDTNIVSLDTAQTYTYTLTCRGSGANSHITTTVTSAPMTVPAKVKITNLANVTSPTNEDLTFTWKSTGNSCDVFDRSSPRIKIGTTVKTNEGVNANYSHSFVIKVGAPHYRTELTRSFVGTNLLGYDIECRDTDQPIRLVANGSFTAEIFKKPTALINSSLNNLTFICTPDYNKVDIKKNNVSLSGYPKEYAVPPTSNFSTSLTSSDGNYLLTCSYKSYSAQDGRSINGSAVNELNIFGAINGVTAAANATAEVNSESGKVNNLAYTISNFDSWTVDVWFNSDATGDVDRSGSSSNAGNLGSYRPDAFGKVNINNDPTVYNNGLYIRIRATKNGVTKTLIIKLVKITISSAKLTVIPDLTNSNPDAVKITLSCDNATNYNLLKNGTSIRSGNITETGVYTLSGIEDIATALTGSNVANYKLLCNSAEDAVAYALPSRTPVKISAFLAQPAQIACPGGNDGLTLKFTMSNSIGKTCRITSSAMNATPNATEKDEQINAINLQLGLPKYFSSNSGGDSNKSLEGVVDDRNGSGISGGQILLYSANKFSSGKRLFNYSTRFKLECDSKTATTQYSTSNITYSSKILDVPSSCTGQD
jgi:hypothetical protein